MKNNYTVLISFLSCLLVAKFSFGQNNTLNSFQRAQGLRQTNGSVRYDINKKSGLNFFSNSGYYSPSRLNFLQASLTNYFTANQAVHTLLYRLNYNKKL